MLQSKAQLNEPVQNLGLLETLSWLFSSLYSSLQIPLLAEVHNDVYIVLFEKTVMVPHHKRIVQLFENLDLRNKKKRVLKSENEKEIWLVIYLIVEHFLVWSGIALNRNSLHSK